MEWKKLNELNKSLELTDVKGKGYVEVNKRVMAFRELEPNGSICTEIVSLENGVVTIKATVIAENGNVLATGFAQEKESSSFINKTSFIENCETSAVGRALGFCGIGLDASIASAEEVANAIHNQKKGKANTATREELMDMIVELCDEKRFRVADVLKKVNMTSFDEMTMEQLQSVIDWLEKK